MTAIEAQDIQWRIGSTYEKGDDLYGILLGYIDSRTAMEHLDALDAAWSDTYEIIRLDDKQGVQCALTVNGITRTDVGVPSNTEGLKGAYSDALKRAAVKHNVGRELYDLPTIAVACEWYMGRDNKKHAKKPKALPRWDGKQWTIDNNLGWVRYDAPPTQPERGERTPVGVSRSSATTPVPAQPKTKGEAMDQYAAALRDEGMSFAQGNDIWKRHGLDRASASIEDIVRIIAEVRGVEQPATEGVEPSSPSVPVDPTQVDSPPGSPASEPTLDDVLAVTGGEVVPPRPDSPEFKALDSKAKLEARVYWQKEGVPT